jgi:hypothetical protein
MKNKLTDMVEKVLLRKRAVIESVNDFLKNICHVEHSRHRSVANFPVNLLGALSAYSFLPHKPKEYAKVLSVNELQRKGTGKQHFLLTTKPSIRGVYDNRALPVLV